MTPAISKARDPGMESASVTAVAGLEGAHVSYAVAISQRGQSVVISFEGDADEAVVVRIVTALDNSRVPSSVIIDLNAVHEPRRTAAYLLTHIDTGRIGGAAVALVCADIDKADGFDHHLAARQMRLYASVDSAVRSLHVADGRIRREAGLGVNTN